jgi:hypothetical protein
MKLKGATPAEVFIHLGDFFRMPEFTTICTLLCLPVEAMLVHVHQCTKLIKNGFSTALAVGRLAFVRVAVRPHTTRKNTAATPTRSSQPKSNQQVPASSCLCRRAD